MAFQSVQQRRRLGSPSSNGGGGKVGNLGSSGGTTGPLKATLPFGLPKAEWSPTSTGGSSVGSTDAQTQANLVKSAAKKLYSSPERTENGSPSYKEKRSHHGSSGGGDLSIRRSGSLDTITSNAYLSGEWPKPDSLVTQAYFCPSNLTLEKATQTPQEWCCSMSPSSSSSSSSAVLTAERARSKPIGLSSTRRAPSIGGNENNLKEIKYCLARTSKQDAAGRGTTLGGGGAGGGGAMSQRTSPVMANNRSGGCFGGGSPLMLPSKPIAIPFLLNKSRSASHCRGSLEGLNQEIEKLNLSRNYSGSDEDLKKGSVALDGRCAPIAQQLKTVSVSSQTPTNNQFNAPTAHTTTNNNTSNAGEQQLLQRQNNTSSSSEDLTQGGVEYSGSPEIAGFSYPKAMLDRLPPEGCEKVCGKFLEDRDGLISDSEMVMSLKVNNNVLIPKPLIAQLCSIPSETSAFNPPPLAKNYLQLAGNNNIITTNYN